jgi:hypothetical protein
MHNGFVANAYAGPHGGSRLLISAVQHGPILNIGFIPDADLVNVAADNGVKPHGALGPQRYVAYNGSIVGHKAMGT